MNSSGTKSRRYPDNSLKHTYTIAELGPLQARLNLELLIYPKTYQLRNLLSHGFEVVRTHLLARVYSFMTSLDSNRFDVTSFEDVMPPAQSYKDGNPTIINLVAEPKDVGRRIVDFFSGLAFGTEGTFEKVAEGIYLITPSDSND